MFWDPGQEYRQSIFYFSSETNSAMGYVNSFMSMSGRQIFRVGLERMQVGEINLT
jgi:hypothetical protein